MNIYIYSSCSSMFIVYHPYIYKIWYLNIDKALLFLRNQAICLKNWKLRRAPTTTKFDIICWNFAHVSYLTISTKGCSGFFILFRTWVINKNLKNDCVETRSFLIFANNSGSKQNKKKSRIPFCRHS